MFPTDDAWPPQQSWFDEAAEDFLVLSHHNINRKGGNRIGSTPPQDLLAYWLKIVEASNLK